MQLKFKAQETWMYPKTKEVADLLVEVGKLAPEKHKWTKKNVHSKEFVYFNKFKDDVDVLPPEFRHDMKKLFNNPTYSDLTYLKQCKLEHLLNNPSTKANILA